METIAFDKYQIVLPKGDLQKEWDKLKKYMDIKLEDYKYEEPQSSLGEIESIEESLEE